MADARASVQITADSRQFHAEMARANQSLAGLSKAGSSVASTFASIGRGLGIFGAALGVAALGRFVSTTIKAGEELHTLSTRLNVSVESLSELQYVAKLNNIEFDSFTTSMQRMVKAIGEAGQGSKSAVETFDHLGLSFKLLSSFSVDQQFEAISNALAQVKDETQRAALAQEVFGRSGIELLQIVNQGTDALRAQRAEARDLGAVMSAETAAAADKASDAIDRMQASVGGLANQLTAVLAPGLSLIADRMRQAFFPTASEQEQNRIQAMRDRVNELSTALYDIQTGKRAPARGQSQIANMQLELDQLVAQLRVVDTVFGGGAGGPVATVIPTPSSLAESNRLMKESASILQQIGMQQLEQQQAQMEAGIPGLMNDPLGGEATQRIKEIEEELTDFIYDQHYKRAEAAAESARERAATEQWLAETTFDYNALVADSAVGFLQAVGREHRGAAIAALAIQKALAIKEIFIASQVAQMQALAQLGPAGAGVAAAIATKAKISAALVAATGLVEASQISSGGTSLGSLANPINTSSAATSASAGSAISKNRSHKVIEINWHGGVVDSKTMRAFTEQIRQAVDDYDLVLFSPDSRQGRALTSG